MALDPAERLATDGKAGGSFEVQTLRHGWLSQRCPRSKRQIRSASEMATVVISGMLILVLKHLFLLNYLVMLAAFMNNAG